MNLETKRVLVTGGTGFLGRYVVDILKRRGYEKTFAVGRADYDLVDLGRVKAMFEELRPDVVLHLAAVVGGIGANRENPGKFFYDNLMMGVQTIDVARQRGIEKFVAVGTVCAYPKFTPVPFRESDLWSGYPEETNAPYGLAKKMLLVQLNAYRQQYDFNGIYLLPVNLYGPGDNFDAHSSHVIPALIRKIKHAVDTGKSGIDVWGTGKATREFLFVEDCAEAIVKAMECYDEPEPINIGSAREISIASLVELLVEIFDFNGEIIWDKSKPDGQPRRCLDTTRAREKLGFEAKTQFREGLERTVDWYIEKSRL